MSLSSAIEVERTYTAAAPDATVPDLSGTPGVAAVRALPQEELDATYYDTEDLRLAAARTTLRRRTGGRDAGWTLKLPAGAGREEVTLPARPRATAVPAELRALVRGRTRGARLVPVARIRTSRAVHQLVAADGAVLAEVADDTVVGAVLLAPAETRRWRELEVELVDGDPALLDAVEEQLRAAGAAPAELPSKLAVTLGSRRPERDEAPLPRSPRAGDVVLQHLRGQVEELVAREPGVRRDVPGAVHKTRVATRRLRSALKTYRPLLDRAATDPVRAELSWLAGVLGGPRDAEVLHARLRAAVDELPPELVLGPVVARLDDELRAEHRAAHAQVVAALDGPRWLSLLESLDALLAAPPWTGRAQRKAAPELRRCVRRTWSRLHEAAERADRAPTPEQRDELLHEVRKTGKQVRYAAESAAPVLGDDARVLARKVKRVQNALGEQQDSAVARTRLRELGVRAHLAGENGFTFGLLHGREELRAHQARRRWEQRREAVLSRRPPRWLR